MEVKLKENLFYSKLTDLCPMDEPDANDYEFLYDVINVFMAHGLIVHEGKDLNLYMKEGDIIDLKDPSYIGPDYICNYHGISLDFNTEGKLEVII